MSTSMAYRVISITSRWVLRESRAQWLVRSLPDREYQTVCYERSGIGWSVKVEERILLQVEDDEALSTT